jgi:hypothetical protein
MQAKNGKFLKIFLGRGFEFPGARPDAAILCDSRLPQTDHGRFIRPFGQRRGAAESDRRIGTAAVVA